MKRGTRAHCRGAVAFIGAALACAATSARADEVADVKSVDLAVTGRIGEHCALGGFQSVDLGDLRRPNLQADAKVAFDCNLPFQLTIKSRNGALSHSSLPTGQGPYVGRLPYTLSVEMPLRRPQAELVQRTFDGNALIGGQVVSSAGAIAVDGLSFRFALGASGSEAGLLAGAYGEIIEVTVSPT